VQYSVISIGTLSRNRLWDETEPKRAAHATTTLIRSDTTAILVDPALPAEILAHRLDERAGMALDDIDAVFLTNFRPVHRRALPALSRASWLMHEPEIEAAGQHLAELSDRIEQGHEQDDDVTQLVQTEQSLLRQIQPADEKLTPQVHLYPTAGVTPGAAGLLLTQPSRTVVIAGDAVVTQDYYQTGRVFEKVLSLDDARGSLQDIMELADEIVPGHDNAFRVMGY